MVKVSDLMSKSVIHSVRPDQTAKEAAEQMKKAQCGCLIVMNRGILVGILTERDLVQRVIAEGRSPRKTTVSQIMSTPVVAISPRAPVSVAARLMLRNKIRRLAVRDRSRVVGMLTTTDFSRYLSKKARKEPMLAASARANYQTIFE